MLFQSNGDSFTASNDSSSRLLPARIGHIRACQMFALGEPMDAATAVACGLANAVPPPAEVAQERGDDSKISHSTSGHRQNKS